MSATDELPAGDWDMLFAAVVGRVRHTLDAAFGSAPATAAATATLHDCMGDLEQLQAALALERQRGEQTRQALQQARATLAAAQGELASLRAATPAERTAPRSARHSPS